MICVMKRFYLTPEEKAQLELRHQSCENRKEGDRIKAILLRTEGWTVPLISRSTSYSSVNNYSSYSRVPIRQAKE